MESKSTELLLDFWFTCGNLVITHWAIFFKPNIRLKPSDGSLENRASIHLLMSLSKTVNGGGLTGEFSSNPVQTGV